MNSVKRIPNSVALAVALLLGLPSLAQAAAGNILFVHGDVRIVNANGQDRNAKKGEELQEGDTIITGKTGAAQVRMVDSGFLAVRPNTQLKVDTFRYAGKTDGSEKGIFTLTKGTFRAITGAVGKVNKDNYEVRTPGATIGIRGTDHEPMFIPMPLPGEIAMGTPGTYDKVNTGEAVIKTTAGSAFVGANQAGFAAGLNTVPVKLPSIPAFYTPAPPPAQTSSAANTAQTGSTSGGTTDSTSSTTTTSDSTTASTGTTTGTTDTSGTTSTSLTSTTTSTTLSPTTTTSTTTQNVTTTGGTINLSTTGTTTQTAVPWSGGVGADMWINSATNMVESGSGGIIIDGQAGKIVQIGANGEMVTVSDTNINGGSFKFSAGTATLTANTTMVLNDTAGNFIAKISWGRWDGNYAVIDQGVLKTSVNSFQYMFSPNLTPMGSLPISGTLNYSFAPGTGVSMDGNGQLGIIGGMQIDVDFGTSSVSYVMNATTPGKIWNAQGSGSVNDLMKNNINLSVKCTGGSCSASYHPMSGKATGLFVGSTAQGIISSFNLYGKDSIGNIVETANGVGALKCTNAGC